MTISGEILIVMKTNPAIWAVPYLLVTRTTNSPKSSGYTWSYLVLIIHLVVHLVDDRIFGVRDHNEHIVDDGDGKPCWRKDRQSQSHTLGWSLTWTEEAPHWRNGFHFHISIIIFPSSYFHYHISISIIPFSYFPLKIWITFSYFTILWILLSFVDKSLNLLCSLKFLIV